MTDAPERQVCRCEARIAPAILDGYACGAPQCWRTAAARASFEAFVARLKAERGDAPQDDAPQDDAPAAP